MQLPFYEWARRAYMHVGRLIIGKRFLFRSSVTVLCWLFFETKFPHKLFWQRKLRIVFHKKNKGIVKLDANISSKHYSLGHMCHKKNTKRSTFIFNMGFPQIIAAFYGLPGNLLVKLTIVSEKRFHVMQCILLASLAWSDFLFLILVNSFCIASIA